MTWTAFEITSAGGSMTDEESVKAVARRLLDAVKPLTSAEVAAGKSHQVADIGFAEDVVLPIPLRNNRDIAWVVTCLCPLCDARRTTYLRP
jgi:hypothetical protein